MKKSVMLLCLLIFLLVSYQCDFVTESVSFKNANIQYEIDDSLLVVYIINTGNETINNVTMTFLYYIGDWVHGGSVEYDTTVIANDLSLSVGSTVIKSYQLITTELWNQYYRPGGALLYNYHVD